MNVYSIVFLCVMSCLFILYFVDKYTNHSLLLTVIQWRPALVALGTLINAIAAALPSGDFAVMAAVFNAASAATQKAEDLYLMGKLPKEERNAYAQLLIGEALQHAGIEITVQVQEIIDGCIAAVCLLMPHGVEPLVSEGEQDAA